MNFLDRRQTRPGAPPWSAPGRSFSLSQAFDMDGPQKGWRRRTNPVHTMLDTGTDAVAGVQGFPHGIGGADDVIAMPLQCSTQWDGLGPHLRPRTRLERPARRPGRHQPRRRRHRHRDRRRRHRRPRASCWTSAAQHRRRRRAARRVRHHRPSTCSDTITAQGPARGGRSRRHRPGPHRPADPRPPRRAGASTPADPHPACPSRPRTGCTTPRSPAIATDTWGFEVRPNEFDAGLPAAAPGRHPAHRPVHRRDVGPGRAGRGLRRRRAVRRPAGRGTASGHRRGRGATEPHRDPLTS